MKNAIGNHKKGNNFHCKRCLLKQSLVNTHSTETLPWITSASELLVRWGLVNTWLVVKTTRFFKALTQKAFIL
ncbi:MAG TPA: hypothetical protein VE954_34925, partial [Oligoflexus sp.]|uniref:hypothetical protein n=1 Tax=Oligoflexus sp. TaxID=1971216 RepID=UPI002D279D30